jgi:hypothetical protein
MLISKKDTCKISVLQYDSQCQLCRLKLFIRLINEIPANTEYKIS